MKIAGNTPPRNQMRQRPIEYNIIIRQTAGQSLIGGNAKQTNNRITSRGAMPN